MKRAERVLWVVWVLWTHQLAGPAGSSHFVAESWDPHESYEQKEQCDEAVRLLSARIAPHEYKRMPDGTLGEKYMTLHCFPDTIDPRGPKEK